MNIDPRTALSHALSQATPQEKKTRDLEQLRESCREFEAILVMEMYKSMRKAMPESGLLQKGMANDLYQEMFDMEIARQTAGGDGMGVGMAMYRQLADQIEHKRYE